MPFTETTITPKNWPFTTQKLTTADHLWLSLNLHNTIYRLKFAAPSPVETEKDRAEIAPLQDELFHVSHDSSLFSLDLQDLYGMCQPEAQLVYVPLLPLQLNNEILQSLANSYQVRAVISLYSMSPSIMMNEFSDSIELINKHFKMIVHRSGASIISERSSTCSLLLVLY